MTAFKLKKKPDQVCIMVMHYPLGYLEAKGTWYMYVLILSNNILFTYVNN